MLNLTYIAEYALLRDHGAFLPHFVNSPALERWINGFGDQWDQTRLRIPMFVYYLVLFGFLLRRLQRGAPLTGVCETSSGQAG